MDYRVKKPLGALIMLAYLGGYIVVATTLGSALLPILPGWAELIFFAIAGVIWVFPLKYLFAWMNKGAPPIPRARDLEH